MTKAYFLPKLVSNVPVYTIKMYVTERLKRRENNDIKPSTPFKCHFEQMVKEIGQCSLAPYDI